MFLQTYLYNYCATLAGLEQDEPLPLVLYGAERVKYLCDAWMRFLSPAMFVPLQSSLTDEVLASWEAVASTADRLAMLSAHCDALLTYAPKGSYEGTYRRFGTVQYLLTQQVIPWLKQLKYYSGEKGRAVCFGNTGRVITSFVPFETVDRAVTVPAVYNSDEYAVVQLYLSVLRNAPSVVAASAAAGGADLNLQWIERHDLPGGYVETSLESRMIAGSSHSPLLYAEILKGWEEELSQCTEH